MIDEIHEPELIELNGIWYLVWRKEEAKGSDYLFTVLEHGIANNDLQDAYFAIKYPPLDPMDQIY